MHSYDAVIVGAGAAGLFCAGVAGQLGVKVLLIDHAPKVAEKIRISGGGRCNFTNRELDPRAPQRHFLGENPAFCRSALARYTSADFIGLVRRHGIPFHEKHKGQLFGDRSSDDFIRMLLAECAAGGVTRWQPCAVRHVAFSASEAGGDCLGSYEISSDGGTVRTPRLVVATGGLPVPQIGATDWGLRLARQFGLRVVEPRPALVPLSFQHGWSAYASLAGLALPVRIATGSAKSAARFDEDLLFTHRGLSGPAVLQISSYWAPGQSLAIDLVPEAGGGGMAALLAQAKQSSRRLLANELTAWMPARLADAVCAEDPAWQRPLPEVGDKALARLAQRLAHWEVVPSGTDGWRKAEVMAGGVDTRALSSQTMEARGQRGLYFIGEVVDVTGWLGGYNFQWAWASAHACARALAA